MQKKIIFYVLIVSLIFTMLVLGYSFFILDEIIVLPMELNVNSSYGFNLETNKLHLGKTVPGGDSSRGFIVSNNKDYPLKVSVIKEGQLAKWTEIEKQTFTIFPSENKTVMVNAYVPKGTEYGLYTGNIKVILKKKLIY